MNIKKVEKQARKINQLLENIKEEGSVSTIEKDLLLSYIRDMYEKVLGMDENKISYPKSAPKANANQSYEEPLSTTEIIETTSSPVNIAEVVRREVVEKVPQSPTISSNIDYQSTTDHTAIEVLEDEVPVGVPQAFLDLFSQDVVSELSDKLGRSPIQDLTKSMGINEKIFTVKELFGGDSNLFSKTMQDLNSLTSLEQARDYLVSNVAIKQDWVSESKVKKATNFIKLISRKY